MQDYLKSKEALIAYLALFCISLHLFLRFSLGNYGFIGPFPIYQWPLIIALVIGGGPLVFELAVKLLQREFGSDLLAGISIITSTILGYQNGSTGSEYLAGALVVLMLSGGQALENYAVRSASSVLDALARRMPSMAHLKQNGGDIETALEQVKIGDVLVVYPHEICPVDGTVLEGHGVMDESYLTGEPYLMSKTPGAFVLSGAINGDSALTIRADKLAIDSRYAKIMMVMMLAEEKRPRSRRIGDQLGAFYTPLAIGIALLAWYFSGDSTRFLSVLVVATPCPLLIAIPVAIIGAISLSARRGIIIKDPAVLEKIGTCRTAIFDKTGTLTYGKPQLTEMISGPEFREKEVLSLTASLERYSKHPLAKAIVEAANKKGLPMENVQEMSEPPGSGLVGVVGKKHLEVMSRKLFLNRYPSFGEMVPPYTGGMECVIAIDKKFAGLFRFRDEPRAEGKSFIRHLGPRHLFQKTLIVSGDRLSEVEYLAQQVGIQDVRAGQTPEQKVEIVREETKKANTIFLGDGINDAPALATATVGVAFGQGSDITTEAAGAVILDTSLEKVDELLHISMRLRRILLESAVGGIVFSLIGVGFAAVGYLPPVAGAILQEAIDVIVVLNALRVAFPPSQLTDYRQ